MAAPSSSSIIRVPANLTWNGTPIGESHTIEFLPQPILRPIWAEELGAFADVIYGGEGVIVKAVLRYPDIDAISAIAPNTTLCSGGGGFAFTPGGNIRAGISLYTRAGELVIVPKYVGHPSVTIYKAIPFISQAARLRFAWKMELGIEMIFYGGVDSSGRTYSFC